MIRFPREPIRATPMTLSRRLSLDLIMRRENCSQREALQILMRMSIPARKRFAKVALAKAPRISKDVSGNEIGNEK